METQDHSTPKQPGHSGGVHCHKCGWQFPNPHPSPKHRRAHKKVCGTIEGHRLDNDAPDKTQLKDGSDAEHVSDDESKTQSDKVVENTISRRSSSGLGSRSSRSNRSEEEVFADAVTDFTDSSGFGEASDGVIQRFYSLQSVTENDSDVSKLTAENASADNLCTPDILLKDEQDQVKTEAGTLSQDHISSSTTGPALASASVTEHEIKVEQEMEQSSKLSHVLNSVADESKEIVSSKEKLELKTSYDETAEEASRDVSGLRAGDNEIQGPVSVGEFAKPTGMVTASPEISSDCSQVVDAPGNFYPLEHAVEVIAPATGSTSKSSDVMKDRASTTETHEDVDHKSGKINTLNAPGSVSEAESVEYGIAHAAEEVCSDNDLIEVGDSKKICSEDNALEIVDSRDNKLKQDFGQKSVDESSNVGGPGPIPDVEASDADISTFRSEEVTDFKTESLQTTKVSSGEELKPIISLENVFPEGGTGSAAAENLEFTSTGAANASNGVKNGTEHVLLEIKDSEVEGKGLSGSSLLADCAINDIPPQVKEPSNIHDSISTGNVGISGDVQTHLVGNEMSSGGEDNEAVNAGITPGSGLSTAGIHKPLEPERTYDHGKSDKMIDSGDLMVGCSSPLVGSTGHSSGGAECIGVNDPGVTLKTDDLSGSSSKIIPDDDFSAAVNDTCIQKLANEASEVPGDTNIKQLVTGSSVEVLPDSSSQTDSLEGNWGSVSVMSAVSDTPPAADTPASNHSQASAAEENASLQSKPLSKSQHSESKTSVEPHVRTRKTEDISEIQTLDEQQQPKGSALQTGWSSSVAHAENVPYGGKREEEIIAKVTNWSTEKHHTPLKTLLGEATARSRAESPIHHNQSSASVPQTSDETPVSANNGFSKTDEVIHSSNNPTTEASKEEMGKEWNSPARYPVNIKTEKKRAKGRPYWAPFLCCSSVNAR